MTNRTKLTIQGKEIEGELIDFDSIKEDWNEYQLKDGTKIKLKVIVSKIIRTDQANELGEPIYIVNSTNIVDATVPEGLKLSKKESGEATQ